MSEEKGRSNWCANDACLLVQIYEPFHGLISGSVRTNNIGRSRETAWQKICDSFSSSGPEEVRTEKQIRDKIGNIKESARKHGSAVRWNKTGGGPPPAAVPAYVLKMYELQGGERNVGLVGINSGMESGSANVKYAGSVFGQNAGGPDEEEDEEEEEQASGLAKCSVNRGSADRVVKVAGPLGGSVRRPFSAPPKEESQITPRIYKKRRLDSELSSLSQSDSLQQRALDEQRALIRENRELIEVQKELANNQNELTLNQNELTLNQNELTLNQNELTKEKKELVADQRQIAWLENIKLRRKLVQNGYRFEVNEEGVEQLISPEGQVIP